jgi:hypothetical protein
MSSYDTKTRIDAPDKTNKILYYTYRCLNVNEMLACQCDDLYDFHRSRICQWKMSKIKN